jgi:flagellar biosynthesis protein FlhB
VWPEKAIPDLERVFSISRIGHIFSKDFVVDLGVSLVKVASLVAAAWWAVGSDLAILPRLALASPSDAAAAVLSFVGRITVACLTVMVVLAVGDSVLGHRRFMQKHRMAREDLKREHKEEDGDPLIKSRRRQRARQLMRERASVTVPTAHVILVNPTHIAVAIRYDRAKDRAPKVVAKGADGAAEMIRQIAREHSIPIVEDIPLARLLYKTVKVGREVPGDTFRAVTTVLAFVYRMQGRR